MSQPYVGEIRMVGFNFPPNGWAICNGALLSIAEFTTLFDLIGTTYGGDGVNTFALPDLQGRVPVHQGRSAGTSNRVIGQRGGVETVTLTANQMPSHTHTLSASTTIATPAAFRSAVLGSSTTATFYGSGADPTTMAAGAITALGDGQPHNNIAPSLTINFVISLFGIFPSQN